MPLGEVRWQRWSDRAVFDKDGHIVEYQSVGRDVTEQKEALERLENTHAELNAAYEQLTATEEELRQNYNEPHKKPAGPAPKRGAGPERGGGPDGIYLPVLTGRLAHLRKRGILPVFREEP